MSIDNVKLRWRGGAAAAALHRNLMAAAAEACQLAVMQQHLRKACGGKFKFFCPVGGKTSWLATITATVWQSYYWQQTRCRMLPALVAAAAAAAAAAA